MGGADPEQRVLAPDGQVLLGQVAAAGGGTAACSYRVSSQLPVKSFTEANMSIRPATPTTAVAMLRTRAPRVATPTSTRAPPAITRLYTPPWENVKKAAQVSHRPSPTSTARKRGPRRW